MRPLWNGPLCTPTRITWQASGEWTRARPAFCTTSGAGTEHFVPHRVAVSKGGFAVRASRAVSAPRRPTRPPSSWLGPLRVARRSSGVLRGARPAETHAPAGSWSCSRSCCFPPSRWRGPLRRRGGAAVTGVPSTLDRAGPPRIAQWEARGRGVCPRRRCRSCLDIGPPVATERGGAGVKPERARASHGLLRVKRGRVEARVAGKGTRGGRFAQVWLPWRHGVPKCRSRRRIGDLGAWQDRAAGGRRLFRQAWQHLGERLVPAYIESGLEGRRESQADRLDALQQALDPHQGVRAIALGVEGDGAQLVRLGAVPGSRAGDILKLCHCRIELTASLLAVGHGHGE